MDCGFSGQFHKHGAYLVDSLWAVARSELRDWGTMTALLLQESGEEPDMTVVFSASVH